MIHVKKRLPLEIPICRTFRYSVLYTTNQLISCNDVGYILLWVTKMATSFWCWWHKMNLSPRVETYHKQYLSPTSLTSIDSAQAFNYEMTNYIFIRFCNICYSCNTCDICDTCHWLHPWACFPADTASDINKIIKKWSHNGTLEV